jgi:hypothetical protein
MTRARQQFGPRIKIRRRIDGVYSGVPDIDCTFDSFSLPIEAKNSKGGLTKILEKNFTQLQIQDMLTTKEAGGFPVGLIFKDGEERYILPEDIPPDGQISLEQFNSLPIFRWEDVRSLALQHSLRFRR